MAASSYPREPMEKGIDEELVKGTGSNPTLSSTLSDTKRWGDIGSPFGRGFHSAKGSKKVSEDVGINW